jgi:hypothetical protein
MMQENRRPRFRLRLRTLLFVVAVLALTLVVGIQQVQISRQQVRISRQQVVIRELTEHSDKDLLRKAELTQTIRELRDELDRAGSSSDKRQSYRGQ